MSTTEAIATELDDHAGATEPAETPEVEVLVEEISIDGMCGVY